MSNDPYLEGRYGGGPPPSGPDFGEWSRGNQDRLNGLQPDDSGSSTGPLLGDDPHAESGWPQRPVTFNEDQNSASEGGSTPSGFNVDAGCAVLLVVVIGAWLAGAWLASGTLPH